MFFLWNTKTTADSLLRNSATCTLHANSERGLSGARTSLPPTTKATKMPREKSLGPGDIRQSFTRIVITQLGDTTSRKPCRISTKNFKRLSEARVRSPKSMHFSRSIVISWINSTSELDRPTASSATRPASVALCRLPSISFHAVMSFARLAFAHIPTGMSVQRTTNMS